MCEAKGYKLIFRGAVIFILLAKIYQFSSVLDSPRQYLPTNFKVS